MTAHAIEESHLWDRRRSSIRIRSELLLPLPLAAAMLVLSLSQCSSNAKQSTDGCLWFPELGLGQLTGRERFYFLLSRYCRLPC